MAILSENRKLDGRRTETRALIAWETEFVDALGGDDVVSPQQRTICRLAAQTRLTLARIDAYLAQMPSPINKGKRALWPIAVQRQIYVDSLLKQLTAIGLERRAKPVLSAMEYAALNAKDDETQGAAP